MTAVNNSHPRAFAVWFKDLDRWDTTFFRGISWAWPKNHFVTLSSLLEAKIVPIDPTLPDSDKPIIDKITFGGEIFVTDVDSRSNYKGRLFWAHEGDFVYSKIRIKQGSCAIVPSSIPAVAVSAEYPVYKILKNKVLPEYFSLLIRCRPFLHILDGLSHGGSTKTRIHPNQFESISVPIPPLSAQQFIVECWQQSQTDIVAEENYAKEAERIAEIEFVKSLGLATPANLTRHKVFSLRWEQLDRWGVGVNQPANRLDINTSCFPVRLLSELIADLENGWSPQCLTRPAEDDEWGVLKVGAVSFGTFDQRQNKALPEKLHPIQRYEVKPGDLIISRANIARYVGACALVKEARPKLMLCDKLFRVVWKTQSAIIPEYLDEVMKTPHLRYQIENALTGTSPTMKNISKPSLLALRIPLPPLAIQKSLIESTMAKRVQAAEAREKAAQISSCIRSDIEAMILGTKQPPSVG